MFFTYNDFIAVNEGLIKIPSSMIDSLIKEILNQYISYLYMMHDKKNANILAKKYGVEIDYKFKGKNKEIEIDSIIDEVPSKIKDNWKLEFGYIKLLIDWDFEVRDKNSKINASYEESDANGFPGYIIINPSAWINLIDTEYSLSDLEKALKKVKFSAYHEATHAVQHNSLKWLNKKQVAKSRHLRDNPNSDKKDKRKEYLISQVEYDPQIKTSIHRFQDKYGEDIDNLRKNIAAFVGAINVEGIKPNEFFITLRNNKIKSWKKAVKLFYQNFNLDISSLLKNVPDE